MGVVFRARHVIVGRTVAMKMILSGDFASEGRRLGGSGRRAEAVANLEHPHIVPIHEVGEHAGRPLLHDAPPHGRFTSPSGSKTSRIDPPRRRPVAVGRRKGDAPCPPPRAGSHRDLKPANVLFDESRGPAVRHRLRPGEAARGSPARRAWGRSWGRPCYMAPEQAAGARTSRPSALTFTASARSSTSCSPGAPPFRAYGTVMETLVRVMEEEPVPPAGSTRPSLATWNGSA